MLSSVLTFGVGVWAFTEDANALDETRIRVWGIFSFVCSGGLCTYGIFFFRKLVRLKQA